jgi:hypothetical protein
MAEKICLIAKQIMEKPAPNKMKQDCIKECKIAVQEAFSRENV